MNALYAEQLQCRPIVFASEAYRQEVALRYDVLRRPLGLHYTEEQLRQEADDLHFGCYFADRLVGCLILRPQAPTEAQLRQFAVAADCQRRGVGTVLLDYVERFAAERGYAEITMHARESAVPFYERRGYHRVGERFFEVTLPHFEMRRTIELLKGCESWPRKCV
jgi:ribosomal protein S18 acetylase RimI-like enzyme